MLEFPTVITDEQMAAIYGKVTNSISLSNGLGLLEGFFTALGALNLFNEVKADYAKKQPHSLKFSFKDARHDSIDAGLMGSRLIRNRFDDRHALVNPGNRYYLVTGLFPGLLCMFCRISLNVGDPGEAGVTSLSSLILEEQRKCLGDF